MSCNVMSCHVMYVCMGLCIYVNMCLELCRCIELPGWYARPSNKKTWTLCLSKLSIRAKVGPFSLTFFAKFSRSKFSAGPSSGPGLPAPNLPGGGTEELGENEYEGNMTREDHIESMWWSMIFRWVGQTLPSSMLENRIGKWIWVKIVYSNFMALKLKLAHL